MRLFNVVLFFFSIGGDKAIDQVDTLASKFFLLYYFSFCLFVILILP